MKPRVGNERGRKGEVFMGGGRSRGGRRRKNGAGEGRPRDIGERESDAREEREKRVSKNGNPKI